MKPVLARRLWHSLEAVNAVTYFTSECRDAPARLGLKGFWMGYFACRAAPMGAVSAGVVEASFFNFHPDRVRRAIPDAWHIAAPADVISARATAAATALRRILSDDAAEGLAARVAPVATRAVEAGSTAGRPLFAANQAVDPPEDPVEALWQAATTLREHRGDSHVALLTGAGLGGCEPHLLFAACEGAPVEMYQQSRGWSPDDWQQAIERLAERGLLTGEGEATTAGRELRADIEARTDELAAEPFMGIPEDQIDQLLGDLQAPAEQIASSGEIMFPNPMGLPRQPGSN